MSASRPKRNGSASWRRRYLERTRTGMSGRAPGSVDGSGTSALCSGIQTTYDDGSGFLSVPRFLLALGVIAFSPAVAAAQADSMAPLSPTPRRWPGSRRRLARPRSRCACRPSISSRGCSVRGPLPDATAAAWQASLNRSVDSAQGARTSNQVLVNVYGGGQEAADSAEAALRKRGLFGINRNLVDLTLDGTIRLELRADRLKNLRCTPASLSDPSSGCRGEINGPRTRQPDEHPQRRRHRPSPPRQRRLGHAARLYE